MESPKHLAAARGRSLATGPLAFALALALALATPSVAQDPAAAPQVDALRAQLAAHPYFSKVDYTIDDSYERVIFVLERPPQAKPDYYGAIVRQLVPYVSELEKVFVAEYAEQLELKRRADFPRTVIAILGSKENYESAFPRVTGVRTEFSRAHFDPETRLAITYEDHFAEQPDPKDRREAVLHEFVHALQFAYFAGKGLMPAPQWFNEGLAEFRSVTRTTAAQLIDPDIDAYHIRIVAALLARPEFRPLIAPIRELVDIDGPGYLEVVRSAAQRAGRRSADPQFEQLATTAFYAQSCILAYFLHNGADGRYREATRDYVGRVMRGERGVESFGQAFKDFDLDAVERDFFAFVGAEMKLRNWAPAALDAVARGSSAITGTAEASASADVPAFDFTRLDWRPEDWQARMAHAVQLAAAGRFVEAGTAVGGVQAPESEAAFVQRATGHITNLARIRDVFLKRAIDSGAKLRFEIDGKTPRGMVLASDEAEFTLKIGRSEQTVSRDLLTPKVLLDQGQDLGVFEELGGNTAALLAFFDGADDADVTRRLEAGGAGKVLQADLARFRALRTADVDLSWAPIAGFRNPADAAAAAAMLQTLQATTAAHRDSAVLRSRRGELEDLARHLVHAAFDPSDPTGLGLHGKVVPLGEEFRVEYDFESADQLADFPEATGQVPGFDRLQFGSPRGNYMRIEGGQLEASGKAERRFALPIQAPFRMTWKAKQTDLGVFLVGSCGQGVDSVALTSSMGDLQILDRPRGIGGDASRNEDQTMYLDKSYAYELEHDGKTITVKVDGKVTGRAESIGELRGGDVFFYMNGAGTVLLDDLTIQGRVDAAAARRMLEQRADAVARGLFD